MREFSLAVGFSLVGINSRMGRYPLFPSFDPFARRHGLVVFRSDLGVCLLRAIARCFVPRSLPWTLPLLFAVAFVGQGLRLVVPATRGVCSPVALFRFALPALSFPSIRPPKTLLVAISPSCRTMLVFLRFMDSAQSLCLVPVPGPGRGLPDLIVFVPHSI